MPDHPNTTESGDSFDMREHAIEEAKRIKADISGGSEQLRIQRAVLDRERELAGFTTERQHTRQEISSAEGAASDVERTLSRLQELPHDRAVFERLPDGTLAGVPAAERDAFADRLNDRREQAQSRAERLHDRVESIERGITINRLAIEWLEDDLDRLEGGE